jgi:hypothetical protein
VLVRSSSRITSRSVAVAVVVLLHSYIGNSREILNNTYIRVFIHLDVFLLYMDTYIRVECSKSSAYVRVNSTYIRVNTFI